MAKLEIDVATSEEVAELKREVLKLKEIVQDFVNRSSAATTSLEERGWLKTKEVLALLGISPSTLYKRVREGVIPPSVSAGGGRVAWRAQDIQHVLDNGVTLEEVKK